MASPAPGDRGPTPLPLPFHSPSTPLPLPLPSSSTPLPLPFHSPSTPLPLHFHTPSLQATEAGAGLDHASDLLLATTETFALCPRVASGARDAEGNTALHVAVKAGVHTALAHLLSRDDVDVDAPGADGWSALLLAARFGRTEAALALLERGADPALTGATRAHVGLTPTHVAASWGHTSVIGHLARVAPQTLDARMRGGLTPLMLASLHGRVATVAALIGFAEVERSAVDADGRDAHALAALAGHAEVVALLSGAGGSSSAGGCSARDPGVSSDAGETSGGVDPDDDETAEMQSFGSSILRRLRLSRERRERREQREQAEDPEARAARYAREGEEGGEEGDEEWWDPDVMAFQWEAWGAACRDDIHYEMDDWSDEALLRDWYAEYEGAKPPQRAGQHPTKHFRGKGFDKGRRRREKGRIEPTPQPPTAPLAPVEAALVSLVASNLGDDAEAVTRALHFCLHLIEIASKKRDMSTRVDSPRLQEALLRLRGGAAVLGALGFRLDATHQAYVHTTYWSGILLENEAGEALAQQQVATVRAFLHNYHLAEPNPLRDRLRELQIHLEP